MADRLDAQVDQVQRSTDLEDGEQRVRRGDDGPQPDRHGDDLHRLAGRVADHRQKRLAAARAQRAPDGEHHARPGDQDDHRGHGDEGQEIRGRRHGTEHRRGARASKPGRLGAIRRGPDPPP